MNLSLTACIYKTFGSGLDVSELTPAAEGFDVKEVAIRFIAKRYSVDADSLFYLNGYEDDTTKHVFIGETYVYAFIFRNVTLTEFIFYLEWHSFHQRGVGSCCVQQTEQSCYCQLFLGDDRYVLERIVSNFSSTQFSNGVNFFFDTYNITTRSYQKGRRNIGWDIRSSYCFCRRCRRRQQVLTVSRECRRLCNSCVRHLHR